MLTFPESLNSTNLMKHMKVFCKEIGPRPSASDKERQAADYVKRVLAALGVTDVQEQPFKSHTSLGWLFIPAIFIAALSVPIAFWGGSVGKIAGGLILFGGLYVVMCVGSATPTWFQIIFSWGQSQNVIAKIDAKNDAKRKIFLVGHLDTNKQRFNAPPPMPQVLKPYSTAFYAITMVIGVLFILSGILNWELHWSAWIFCALLVGAAFGLIFDETQPHIEGANDNATAATLLLGAAEALKSEPLQNTDVTLLFTGCEEVPCTGIENYLQAHPQNKDNTYWIDIEMVGTGNLCYVTQHGLSYFTQYYPAPQMVKLAEAAAQKNPELKVIGKEMLILEEIANIRRHGYQGLCIAGYGENGFLPNWHRVTDTLENIETPTLERAGHYVWALLKEIDQL